jgi:hypothetical protein
MTLRLQKWVLLALVLTLVGCVGLTPDVYRGYAGEEKPKMEVAIVRAVSAEMHQIDGKKIQHSDPKKFYRDAHLLPGEHTIMLTRSFMVSVMIVPRGRVFAKETFSVDLEAGHVYELHADRTTGPGFQIFLWIKDSTSGRTVAGKTLH